MERDLQSLLDMLQSAEIVMEYISGRSREDLATDLQFLSGDNSETFDRWRSGKTSF